MKIIAKYHELGTNEIYLYQTPMNVLKTLIDGHPVEVVVKEYRPRKIKKTEKGETYILHPNKALRHQIKVIHTLGAVTTYFYSSHLDADGVRTVGLVPIPAVEEKETLELAMRKLDPNIKNNCYVEWESI